MKRTLTLTAHRHNEQSNVYNFTDSDGNEWAMFGNQKGTSTPDPAVTTLAAELAKSLGTPQDLDAYEKDGKRYIFGRPKAAGGGRKPERDEDRMDARTALMQAVIVAGAGPRHGAVLDIANEFIGWLRKQHGASVGAGVRGSTSAPSEQSGGEAGPGLVRSRPSGGSASATSAGSPTSLAEPKQSPPHSSRGTGGARSKAAVKPVPGSAAGPHAPVPETPQAPSGPLSWIDAEALQALKVVMPGANVQALDKWMRIWCRRHDLFLNGSPVCPHPPSDKFDELMDAIATLAHQEKLA